MKECEREQTAMKIQLFPTSRPLIVGLKRRFAMSARRVDLRRVVVLLTCLVVSGGVTGCVVRQATHDDALQRIQSLEAANRSLIIALDTAQTQRNHARHEATVPTDNRRLQDMLSRSATILHRQGGAWAIQYGNVPMMVMTSEQHARIRIMAMVGEESLVKEANLPLLMQVNFDKALDARYALFQDKLWALYLHPLGSLSETGLTSALMQVANLVETYGTTYSSSALQFQGDK